jgi:hypothetical protein
LEAPVKKEICERCFAQVTSENQICPECGAPLKSDGSVQVADSAMHAELAQANVLRLRGEREAAEKQCLSILKRYPNEPEAHSLLGELSADKGDFPRAIEWFELALDLNPNSAADRARLQELTGLVQKTEDAETDQQLGLPKAQKYTPWIFGFVGLIVIIVAFAALRSPRNASSGVNGGTVNAPRVSGSGTMMGTSAGSLNGDTPVGEGQDTGTSSPKEASLPSAPLAMEDRALMQALQKGTYGDAITSVEQDPRDKALVVTYTVPRPEDARRTGAVIAKEALDRSTDSLIVTVRGVSGDRLVFVADGSRPALSEIEGQSSQDYLSGNDAWISTFLQREWPSQTSATNAPGAGSGGTTSAGMGTVTGNPPPGGSVTGNGGGAPITGAGSSPESGAASSNQPGVTNGSTTSGDDSSIGHS